MSAPGCEKPSFPLWKEEFEKRSFSEGMCMIYKFIVSVIYI